MTTVQFKVRLGEELHSAVKQAAEQSNRSVNAEIVNRLELSFLQSSPQTKLVNIERARELAAIARQQLPTMIMDKVALEINRSIALGHSGAYVSLNEFELEYLSDEHFEKILEPVTSNLNAAGYTVEDLNVGSISIDF